METLELIQKFTDHHAMVTKALEAAQKKVEREKQENEARFAEVEQKLARAGGIGGAGWGFGGQTKTWGQAVVESDQFQQFKDSGARGLARIAIETKAIVAIGSGAAGAGSMIAPDLQSQPIALPTRRPTIRNLVAPGTTTSNTVEFSRAVSRQNMAAVVAEGALKPQSDLTMELVTTPVRTVAHFMIASRQALDDAAALQSLIDADLRSGLALAEEVELLTGDGTGEHLLGIIPQASAYIAAFVVTGETAIDRLALGLLQSELSLLPASGIVLHPTDWTKMKMLKDATGRYILGDPSAVAPPTLWGVPLTVTPAITVGSFLTGGFRDASQIFDRMQVEVLISTEDSDNFRKNLITIRCEERLAFAVKRSTAFITGTLP